MADTHGTATAARPGLSPITFPQLGESVVEGTVLQFMVKPGDSIEEDTLLAEIETEKVTAEIPSPFKGTVAEYAVAVGDTVPVGTVLLWIQTGSAAEVAAIVAAAPPAVAEPETDTLTTAMTDAAPDAAPTPAPTPQNGATASATNSTAYREAPDAAVRYSPAVRKLAKEFNLDPATVTGTGAGGRVTRDDMTKAYEAKTQATPTAPAAIAPPAAAVSVTPAPAPATPRPQSVAPSTPAEGDLIPMTTLRRRTAEALVKATQTIPQASTWVEADVTDLVRRRDREKEAFRQREGVPLTFLPFFVAAALAGVREYPVISSQWTDEGIRLKRRVGMGIAVSTDAGLQVPVIHNAGDYSITGLARAMNDLITRARTGKLKLPDIEGCTFTLSNPGSFGSTRTLSLVRPGEAAIYSVDAIVERPVVRDGGIAIRSIVNLGLSFDHRIFDGREAVLFLVAVKNWLENDAATISL